MHTDRYLNITHRLTDALVMQRASNTATLTVSLSLHSVHMSRLFTTKHRKHNGPAYNCQYALFSRFTSILLDVQNMSSIQSTRLVTTLRFLHIILMVLSVLLSTNARNHAERHHKAYLSLVTQRSRPAFVCTCILDISLPELRFLLLTSKRFAKLDLTICA